MTTPSSQSGDAQAVGNLGEPASTVHRWWRGPESVVQWLGRQPRRFRVFWAALPASGRLELVAYALLLVAALGSRLWDLGGRTLHYDELLHAWYSWLFSEGGAYTHTPLMHGPFLFHVAAASYVFLGSSDLVARLVPALFGAALVVMPLFLRRELGRPGALITALFIAMSPSILYFSRFIRNDVYMAVWVLGLVIVMWRYMERPRGRLLYLWVVLWALAFTTKETAYITAGILSLPLLVMAWPELVRWVSGRLSLSQLSPPGVLLLLLVTMTLPLWAPLLGLFQDLVGLVLVNADPNDPVAGATRAAVETGAPAGGGVYIAAYVVLALAAVSIALGLLWDRRRWPLLALVFVAIWLPLYTSLFTNWQGFFTGLWGSLGYWIAQQPVERAGQPWFYYLILGANYEFLAMFPAFIGAPFLMWRGRPFDRFLVYWTAVTFASYMLAGEKMPWLMMGVVLPATLLGGRSVGLLIAWVPWTALRKGAAFAVGIGGALLLGFLLVLMLQVAGPSQLTRAPLFWLSLLGILVVVGLIVLMAVGDQLSNFSRRVEATLREGADSWRSLRTVLALLTVGALVLMVGGTTLVTGRASYSRSGFEQPTELLVYSQTGQETTWTADYLERLAQRSGKGADGLRLLVGESDNFSWQWRWYARQYAQVTYRSLNRTPLTESPDVDVVLMSKTVEQANQEALDGFTKVGELHHLWWFPNPVYKEASPDGMLRGIGSRDAWRGVLDYFFFRRLEASMYRVNGVVYVADEYADVEWSPRANDAG